MAKLPNKRKAVSNNSRISDFKLKALKPIKYRKVRITINKEYSRTSCWFSYHLDLSNLRRFKGLKRIIAKCRLTSLRSLRKDQLILNSPTSYRKRINAFNLAKLDICSIYVGQSRNWHTY